jgi:hypothetical protein
LKIDTGTDPQAERHAEKRAAARAKADSIEALGEAYIERHAKKTKRSWRADQGLIKNKILPRWKGRPVTSLTRGDCRELVQGIADGARPSWRIALSPCSRGSSASQSMRKSST